MSNPITEDLIKKVLKDDELKKVYKLDMSIMRIDKIDNLNLVPQLRCLILNYNNIITIQNLRFLTDLRELYLENNLINKISGIQSCKNLTVLNLTANKIEVIKLLTQKIENLDALIRLDTLNLDHNKITKLNGIENLKDLKNLFLSWNQIQSVDYIPAFSKLEQITLSNNQIKNINKKFFQNCPKLIRLDVSHNKISNVNFLEYIPNIEYLQLSHNKIENIQLQTTFNYLETIDISNNQISELPYIPSIFPDLMNLNISNNFITNEMCLIQAIAGIDYLVELDFRNNPMYNENFENTIYKLHHLDVINGKTINKIGEKYKQKINDITKQFRDFPQIYMNDDKFTQEITNVCLFDQQLQFQLTGIKSNRPQLSQTKTKQVLQKQQETLDNQEAFFQYIQQTNEKINRMRNQYMMIFKRNGIVPKEQKLYNETNQINKNNENNKNNEKSRRTQKSLFPTSQKIVSDLIQNMKLQNQKSKNKWNQLKLKEKGFQIRDLKKKNMVSKESNGNQVSLPKIISKYDMFKTQLNPFDSKLIQQVMMTKTFQKRQRPNSLKK